MHVHVINTLYIFVYICPKFSWKIGNFMKFRNFMTQSWGNKFPIPWNPGFCKKNGRWSSCPCTFSVRVLQVGSGKASSGGLTTQLLFVRFATRYEAYYQLENDVIWLIVVCKWLEATNCCARYWHSAKRTQHMTNIRWLELRNSRKFLLLATYDSMLWSMNIDV